ncbi:abortive infection protein [Labedaea rhizosphaerae]|uniref:Abortive infection protein n=1 Tax=Labedaea rhizosphaerae TaxID=598644 RepID=A0A4V3CZP2_LABRH|nr:abortive infection protein [Labedaea rhizosphaerae]TDQ00471.1 hypothetical protein EV186_102332 [Labedaea rhizosphaerae]
MRRRGVLYDVGRVLGFNWRPVFDPRVVRRELEIIRDDLGCNAVKICGRDVDRLTVAAEHALALGLEVWFSPELWDQGVEATLAHIAAAAVAGERLRRRWPDRLVFSVATESTLFMRGIIKGRTFLRRLANVHEEIRAGRHRAPLEAFLTRATRQVRDVFGGPITYASLPFERVDWDLFDIVGVDHYRDARSGPRYLDTLERLSAHGKPVVVTEFGMRTYRGADRDGKLGTGITDWKTVALHQLPLVGRLVRPRLVKGDHVRDEGSQATRIAEDLTILEAAGVDGAFVCQFVEPLSCYSPDPRYDLDMGALSLVKTYAGGRGTTYPDMAWEPKESFHAVARFYGNRPDGRVSI